MKRIIYIAVILMGILPFFGKELQSSCFAQSMSSESLWDKADETGEYSKAWCKYCGETFEGNDIDEVESMLNSHLFDEHFDEEIGENNDNEENNDGNSDNNNDDSSGSDNSGSNNNGNSGNYYTNVIDVEYAATIAQQIGLDSKNSFLNNYYCYGNGYLFGKTAYLSDFINFIMRKYGAMLINSPSTLNYYNKYFIFAPNNISGYYRYYKIVTNYGNIPNSYYGIFVF